MVRRSMVGRVALGAVLLTAGACSSSDVGSSETTASVVTATPTTMGSPSTSTSGSTSTASSSVTTSSSSSSSATTSTGSGSSTTSSSGSGTIEEVLSDARNGDVSAFLAALRASGVADQLRSKQVTVFAPNDTAFTTLGKETVTSILADPTELKTLVLDHVVEGAWPASKLATVTTLTAVSGRTLAVSSSGGKVTVEGATVTRADDSDRPVVVHVIDRVLTGR